MWYSPKNPEVIMWKFYYDMLDLEVKLKTSVDDGDLSLSLKT